MMDIIIDELQVNLKEIESSFEKQISKFRTGRANAGILDLIFVSMYGEPTQLKHCSKISIPEPQQLLIKPYDRSILTHIAGAISKSNLNLNPIVEADQIRIKIPDLTQELRQKIVKDLHQELENFKVQARNARRHANDLIKNVEGISEDFIVSVEKEIDKLTKNCIEKLEAASNEKEEEILKI